MSLYDNSTTNLTTTIVKNAFELTKKLEKRFPLKIFLGKFAYLHVLMISFMIISFLSFYVIKKLKKIISRRKKRKYQAEVNDFMKEQFPMQKIKKKNFQRLNDDSNLSNNITNISVFSGINQENNSKK